MSTTIESGIGGYGESFVRKDLPHVEKLSPREIQIMEFKAMGMVNKEIAWRLGISQDTVKNTISFALYKSGSTTFPTILALINSGKISRERVSEGLDFEKGQDITGKEREIMEYISCSNGRDQTIGEMAHSLGIAQQTLKNYCANIYHKLDVPNLLRLRIFLALMPSGIQ